MGKKGKKKAPPEDPNAGIDAGLQGQPIAALKDRIENFQDRLINISKDRNFMQLEKDMVSRFYDITKQQVKQIESELLDMDRQMETLERDHRVHIKVHEQRVQNLEYEHKEQRRQVARSGDDSIQREREDHSDRVLNMNREKIDTKTALREDQLQGEETVNVMKHGFKRNIGRLRTQFENNHHELQEQYDHQVTDLREDLELRRRVEVHEVEERKNQHINELLFNHQEAFDEIKAYYNDITRDNLQLIKNLRDEIHDMRERAQQNQKKMTVLTQENKDLSKELAGKLKDQQELEERLKCYAKDKMALKNLRAHSKKLEERTTEAKQEYRTTEEKYRKLEKERDDLQKRFRSAVRDIARKTELGRNAVLEKKLEHLTVMYDEKQGQLSDVLKAAKLDPSVVANVTKKLEQVLGAKNRQIKDLQYQVHQATKAYNDTIRVYEHRLPDLGVQPEEIGFEEIQSSTSKMPARLVTRMN